MSKLYLSAPMPFVGQKRMFAKVFIKVLRQFPDGTTFVDLFGGSGLLSHITKHFNPRTNHLIADIRKMVGDSVPRHKIIRDPLRKMIFDRIEEELGCGFVDFITRLLSHVFHEIQDGH